MLLKTWQRVKSRTGPGWVLASETFANMDVGGRAYRDVLVACLRSKYPARAHTVHSGGTLNSIHPENLKGFASHIHVLYREVPYILYITRLVPQAENIYTTLFNKKQRWIPGQARDDAIFIRDDTAFFATMMASLGAILRISYAAPMRETTDEQLMQRYANGDAKAFDQLYARHRAPLYRYFNRQVNNAATANDLYQGAWEKIIKARRSYHTSKPFTAWMYRIAHNHMVDHYRRTRPIDPIETDVLSDHQPGPAQGAIDGEQNEQLRAGIIALPAEQRNTLLLKLETGLKMEEIANVTGVSMQTVKSRLRYAVNKLKRSLVE